MIEDPQRRAFHEKDFQLLADSLWRNEALGESRLNLFIGVITAVLGGLGFLAKTSDGIKLDQVRPTALGAVFALVALGVLTLMRILKRNDATDRYKGALRALRLGLGDKDRAAETLAWLDASPPRSLISGGLKHIVSFINAGLVGLFAWFALMPVPAVQPFLPIVAMVIAVVLQEVFIASREEAQKASHPKSDTQSPGRKGN